MNPRIITGFMTSSKNKTNSNGSYQEPQIFDGFLIVDLTIKGINDVILLTRVLKVYNIMNLKKDEL